MNWHKFANNVNFVKMLKCRLSENYYYIVCCVFSQYGPLTFTYLLLLGSILRITLSIMTSVQGVYFSNTRWRNLTGFQSSSAFDKTYHAKRVLINDARRL